MSNPEQSVHNDLGTARAHVASAYYTLRENDYGDDQARQLIHDQIDEELDSVQEDFAADQRAQAEAEAADE